MTPVANMFVTTRIATSPAKPQQDLRPLAEPIGRGPIFAFEVLSRPEHRGSGRLEQFIPPRPEERRGQDEERHRETMARAVMVAVHGLRQIDHDEATEAKVRHP